jgi:hypothetical protein
MMRLYDLIQQSVGTPWDQAFRGAITNVATAMRNAQCFELSTDVVSACEHVLSTRPSTILEAIYRLRLPYDRIWIEWTAQRTLHERPNNKPPPTRLGALIEADNNPTNQKGCAIWAWHHQNELTICPIGMKFDWCTSNEPIQVQIANELGISPQIDHLSDVELTKKAFSISRYAKFVNPTELRAFIELEKRATRYPSGHALAMFTYLFNHDKTLLMSFADDVAGELPFVEAFLIMLNSPRIINHQREDLTKLNKARAKSRKKPLREFTITKLNLSRGMTNRIEARTQVSRDQARLHLVRGHFKVRKSGVYWWNSFPRGQIAEVVERISYKVNASS